MKANELRIANWVQGNTEFQIEGSDIALAQIREKTVKTIHWQPIQLTEEWLVRFGFEPHSGIHFHSFKNGGYIAIGNDGSCGLYNNLSSYNRGTSFNQLKDVDFVHQLQNLYFALTGEELTIKEQK